MKKWMFQVEKEGTKSDKCPHKGQHCQLGARVPSRILPCLSSFVPLACCSASKSKTRKRSGTKKYVRGPCKGKREEKKIPPKWVEMDQEQSEVWTCTKRTNLYFDKEINYLHGSGASYCAGRETVKKISDANLRIIKKKKKRKCGIGWGLGARGQS